MKRISKHFYCLAHNAGQSIRVEGRGEDPTINKDAIIIASKKNDFYLSKKEWNRQLNSTPIKRILKAAVAANGSEKELALCLLKKGIKNKCMAEVGGHAKLIIY